MNKVSWLQASVTTKNCCLFVPQLSIYMPELSLAMLYNKVEMLSVTYSKEKRVVQLMEISHLL